MPKKSRGKRPKRRLKKGFKRFLAVTAVVAVALVAILSVTVWFPVKTVRVRGSGVYSEETIVEASGIAAGDNTVRVLLGGAGKRVERSLPYVKSAKCRATPFGTVYLDVTPYIAEYQFARGDKYLLAARDGTILEIRGEPAEDLPIVLASEVGGKSGEKATLPDTVEETFTTLTAALKAAGETPTKIDIRRPGDIRVFFGEAETRLGSGVYLAEKLSMYRRVAKENPDGGDCVVDLSEWTPSNKKASYYSGT